MFFAVGKHVSNKRDYGWTNERTVDDGRLMLEWTASEVGSRTKVFAFSDVFCEHVSLVGPAVFLETRRFYGTPTVRRLKHNTTLPTEPKR